MAVARHQNILRPCLLLASANHLLILVMSAITSLKGQNPKENETVASFWLLNSSTDHADARQLEKLQGTYTVLKHSRYRRGPALYTIEAAGF
jgi:hypothetical protein